MSALTQALGRQYINNHLEKELAKSDRFFHSKARRNEDPKFNSAFNVYVYFDLGAARIEIRVDSGIHHLLFFFMEGPRSCAPFESRSAAAHSNAACALSAPG